MRAGYRHGKRARRWTASEGATAITRPRARIDDAQGQRRERRSRIIPRYQRRTERVDEAILGVYLSGTNTRGYAAHWPRCCVARRYRRMICAPSPEAVEQARAGFLREWKLRGKAASASFGEAGGRTFHLHCIPRLAMEGAAYHQRAGTEFRWRTKTQASRPSEEAVLLLLFSLLHSGQMKLHRLIGWQALISPQQDQTI